jgi:hypothetical protein
MVVLISHESMECNKYVYTCVLACVHICVSEFSSLGRGWCRQWQCHEAAVIKMACTIEKRAFGENLSEMKLLFGKTM